MADGGYQGNHRVIMPYRKPRGRERTAAMEKDLNTVHKRIRARVEHAFAHMKSWNILRNCRRKGRSASPLVLNPTSGPLPTGR